MSVNNIQNNITISGEMEIVITYELEVDRELSLSEKLLKMEEKEKEIIAKIKLLEHIKKVEI